MNYTLSLNNRLIVESYRKEDLKAKVQNGFAMISQKVAVKGLTVLVDAKLNDGSFIWKGSKAYIREEVLHTQAWAQKVLESDAIEGPFLIVDLNSIEFVVPPPSETKEES